MHYHNNPALNTNKQLSPKRVTSLISTYRKCIDNPQWSNGVVAARMDFSISNKAVIWSDIPSVDTYQCFDTFINRLRRRVIDGKLVSFVANWKKEYSPKKGQHIHTVFYFNRDQFSSITPNTNLFKEIKALWECCTDHSSLPKPGSVNLIPSYLCDSLDTFKAKPLVTNDARYLEPHYYTVLTNNLAIFEQLDGYHQQKHYQECPCGFLHWISYLAKTEQQAFIKKSFGTVCNAVTAITM